MSLTDGSVFRVAAQMAPNGIVVFDEAGTILFVNHQIEETFGYSSEELVGRSIDDLVSPDHRTERRPPREKFWQQPHTRTMGAGRDLSGRRKDGSQLPLELDLTVTDRDGRRLVVASLIDITDRQALQNCIAQTSQEHATFERLVTELAARFVMVRPDDVENAIVDGIRQIAEALGLDRGSWWELRPGNDDAVVRLTWTGPEYRVMPFGESARVQVPWLLARIREGEVIAIEDVDDMPSASDREGLRRTD